jgi:cytochrome b involved in lipid metabolism
LIGAYLLGYCSTPKMNTRHYIVDDHKFGFMCLCRKVYDVTPYVSYHPGGEKEIMRGAGRDATKLFGE